MTPTMVEMARRMLDTGHKPGEIARELRVGAGHGVPPP
jgi:hypothetical protein